MFLKFYDAFLKFDLPSARFLNFTQNSASSLIGPFHIVGDCVYTRNINLGDILVVGSGAVEWVG